MQFDDIDRFSESHDATLANITVILYERLGCTQDASYDYILNKLREIEEFDSAPIRHNLSDMESSHVQLLDKLWNLKNGRKRRNHGTT